MESVLESQPFNYSMEDIRFGDDNSKAEKVKQSFLQLKQKICRTNDVIQQYSNKVKECERLKIDVENAKKEAEEWKTQHFTSLAKLLKLNTEQNEVEKSKKMLAQKVSELEIKTGGDQKHLQQLMCKLEDIEDRHSEKLMTIELEKSALKSKVAELEQEMKVLHKTYDIKKDDPRNSDKPKKGKKIKSPRKTTRHTGLLEIADEINANIEKVNTQVSSQTKSFNVIDTNEIEKKSFSTSPNLPNLLEIDVPTEKLDTNPNSNLFDHESIQKRITCDKSVMTDEFYSTKNNVYPLLCDKCEEQLEPMPIDKIYKVMTTIPPLISIVPPSPMRSMPVDQKKVPIYKQTPPHTSVHDDLNASLVLDKVQQTPPHTVVHSDSNVNLVLDKVQQTLESLEKRMKKNNKRKNEHNKTPHCSHTFPIKCCNHSNNLIHDNGLSPVNMMTAFWSSMMQFANQGSLSKNRVKRKNILHKKGKRRKEIKMKSKDNSNSWIIESVTSVVADSDLTIESPPKLPKAVSNFKTATNTIIEDNHKKPVATLENTSEHNVDIEQPNTDVHVELSTNIQSQLEDDMNYSHNTTDINSFKNTSPSTQNSPSTTSTIVKSNIYVDKTTENVSTASMDPPMNVDPTTRKQMRPANVTQSVPKCRTGLLQKLQRLSKKKNPVSINFTKAVDYSEPMDENENSTTNPTPEVNRRIAHVNKKVLEEQIVIPKTKRNGVMHSVTESKELILSPTSTTNQLPHSSITTTILPNVKENSMNVSQSIMDKLFGSDSSDETEENDSFNIDDTINKVLSCDTSTDDNISECSEENKEKIDVSISKLNDEGKGNNIQNTTDAKISNLITNQNTKSSLLLETANVEKTDESKKNIEEKEINMDIIPSQILEQSNVRCLSEQVESAKTSLKNGSSSMEKDKQIYRTAIQPINSSSINGEVATNIYVTPPRPTRNTRSTPIKSSCSTLDKGEKLLRKRKRSDSVTKSDHEDSPKSSLEKKNRTESMSSESTEEAQNNLDRNKKKRTVPEMLQNEISRFFTKKRIVTRSMKKNEKSLILTSPEEQTLEMSPIKQDESSNILKKSKTPVEIIKDTSINGPKTFIKNLLSVYNGEGEKSSSNFNNNSSEDAESTRINVEIANSLISNIPYDNIKKETEVEIDNIRVSDSNDITCQSPKISIANKMVINKMTVGDLVNLKTESYEREQKKDKRIEQHTSVIPNSYNDSIEKIEIEDEKSDIIEPENHGDDNKKSIDSSINCEYDSPLSPDAIPVNLPDCPESSNCTTSREFTDTLKQQSSDKIPQQSEEEIENNSRISKHLVKYYAGSSRELRNRTVPVIAPKTIPTLPKSNFSCSASKEKVNDKPKNIKGLLHQHLVMIKRGKENGKLAKHQAAAAIKITEEMIDNVKKEIMRLIDSTIWDNAIYQSVVENVSKIQNSGCIVKAIINLIRELSLLKEALDRTYTPPAPLMTRSQQKIITLLISLDKVKPNLLSLILDAINYNLFHVGIHLEVEEILSLARIFVVLCKLKKDRERVRIMICDAIYSLQSKSHLVVHTALTCWTEVLPMYNESQHQHLPMCIVHMIKHHVTKQINMEGKSIQLKIFLKRYYNYPDDDPLATKVLDELLNELKKPHYDRSILTAILLLAKKEGIEWTYKHVIKDRLLKIIIENKVSSPYDALTLLGYMMKCFPLSDPDEAVKSIAEQLCAILDAGTVSVDIQEGVAMALLLLSTRHYRYSSIVRSILKWQPPRPLSPALQQQLEILFNSRTVTQWRKMKM